MGLVLYSGYYDKKEALEILNNMKYYKRNLEPFESDEELQKGMGIIPYIRMYENKMHEDFLVDKLKVVKSILEKQGNEAIDAYQEITSPNEHSLISPLINMLDKKRDKQFIEVLTEFTIPMKKEEFYHYLDIYNQFYKKKIIQ